MLILQKGQFNELTLNVNNNTRVNYSAYTLTFTHVVSQEIKSYVISTSGPNYFSNIRYCQFDLDLTTDDLNYEGQYSLEIRGDGTELVYVGMVDLLGTVEDNSYTEYISTDDNNEQYIYIQT
jgi:uncharacterized metal-binding protein YceD (DUF177 family)